MSEVARIRWYRTHLDKQTLSALTARSDLRGLGQIGLQLAFMAALGAAVFYGWYHWHWLIVAVLYYLYCMLFPFLGLAGAGHELCHRTVFRRRWLNELFVAISSFPMWVNYPRFRASHHRHHQYTVHAALDREVVLPLRFARGSWLYMATFNLPAVRQSIGTAIRHARGKRWDEWEERILPPDDVAGRRQVIRWARVMLIGHIVLAGAFIALELWPMLLLVTLAPFIGGWLNFLCGFPQHAGLRGDVPDFRESCRTMTLNPVLRFFYWNMNYHLEHHMYAAVPFYNLPKLRKAIEHDVPPACRGLRGAWKELSAALVIQKNHPDYYYRMPVPGRKEP